MNDPSADRVKIAPGFWTSLRGIGVEPIDVARQARLPLTVITEPFVTTAQYYSIWQAYSERVGDIAAGIVKLATSYETAQYPPAAMATIHARDYRDALNRMARYKQMCPPENLRIQEEGEQCSIELEWQHDELPGPPVLVGITLAYLLELGRRGTGRHLKAHSVEFITPMGDVQALERYFGCRVRTGTGRNRLILNRDDLDRPFTSYNEELLEILTPALDRTLEERQTQLSVSAKEVAFLVGYEDYNSFYRAFRSWKGETPANWRVAQENRRSALVTE